MRTIIRKNILLSVFVVIGLIWILMACADSRQQIADKDKAAVKKIANSSELKTVLDNSADQLLMFDLYADWCGPCKILAPILEVIASENPDKVKIYKINVDDNPDIARQYGVTGIPFVVLIKNKKIVESFLGLREKQDYLRAIEKFSAVPAAADGE